ncbi:unnamed protein product [Mytilus coruscus]|uniref:HMCN n=1 Tax=Mytilus coruscus TaxID=42192 RepID=A0A6J8BPW9_MYTCO|nr:unnamed protein product [Mytilus coruscus]
MSLFSALYQLSTFPNSAVEGKDFTFKCSYGNSLVEFRIGEKPVCIIKGYNPDNTCNLAGSYDIRFTYTCDSSSYNLTIPGILMTENLHGTKWECLNVFDYSQTSGKKELYITVPINTVTISSAQVDENPVKVIKGKSKEFTCRTDSGRPPATIQWYLSNVNITYSARNQSNECATDCSDGKTISSSQLIYKGNTDDIGKTIYCTALNIEGYRVRSKKKTIDILYSPTTPAITQTPTGPVNENTTITLTCIIKGGNPLANITWYCNGSTPVDSNGTLMNSYASISYIQLIAKKSYNGFVCSCTGSHPAWTQPNSTSLVLHIRYSPTTPAITQTPTGPVNENTTITLTCIIKGGNPLANITWYCNGSTPVDSNGTLMSSYASISYIQLIAKKSYNGFVCSCTGSHPAWTQPNSTSLVLHIRYAPAIQTITQIPIGPVNEGNMVILTCEISGGYPLASITWICDGFTQITTSPSPLHDKVVSSIEFNVTRNSDFKECICRGQHPLWTENKEERHTLTVYFSPDESPSITQTPVGSVDEGSQVYLTCEVQGGKPLAKIEWQCDGSSPITSTVSPSTDKTISSVEITVTKYQNGEMCTCSGVHPTWNQNKSTSIQLDVNYPPELFPPITQTASGPIIEDNKVILTCEIIGGNPLATLSWQCNGFTLLASIDNLPTNKLVSSIEKNVTKADNDKICTCTGQHRLWTPNQKIRIHTLNVYYSSTIQIVNKRPISLVENKTIVLICTEVDGNPRNASFVWYKSNTIIGATANFSISEAHVEDAGNYTCKGSNGFGRKSEATVEVFVLYSPIVSVSFVTNLNTIAEDNTAVLQCTVQSNPPPNIVWTRHRSNTILHSTSTVFQSNLTIDNADCFDTGNYTCKAMNIINNNEYTTMKDIELFVKCSPRRYNGDDGSPNPRVLAIGENLTISQHIIAFPMGITSWIFKHDENSPETTVYSSLNCSTYNVTNHHICFSRHNLTATNFGLYSVVIENDVGKATFTYNIIPEGPPKQPTNILVACEITSMIVSWRPGFNGGIKQYFRVVWLNIRTQQTKYSSEIMDSNPESTKQYIVKSLTPDTPYIIYVQATNKHGIVRSTDNDNCTTGSSLFNSQLNNSLVTSVAAAIGITVFILLVASLVIFVLKRRRMKNKKEDSKLYQSTQPGTSRQRTNNDEHDYSELQTKRMDFNPDGIQANSSNTYEEVGRINDGQIYQNVCRDKEVEINNQVLISKKDGKDKKIKEK